MKINTIHTIDGEAITVTTHQTSTCPLAYKIRGEHPSGTFHETVLTIGDEDLKNIATLEEAQEHLDAARNNAALLASKKASLAKIASQLQ